MRYKSYSSCVYSLQTQVKEIYEKSFPKSEKFPFWVLKKCAKEKSIRLDAIIDNITDKIVGMQFLVNYDDITYLMYLAIDENNRNKKLGSLVLRDLLLRYDTIILCIEKPAGESDNIKTRRKKFYLRNGFFETNRCIVDSGVEYEFLISSKGRIILENDLKKRYTSMTKNPLIRFVIKHIFDKNIYWI